MKTLTLVRHAKSNWDDVQLADHERPLNSRGRSDAPLMGEKLAGYGCLPEQVWCSTALRARQTAELLLAGAKLPLTLVEYRPEIYEASLQGLLALIRTLPRQVNSTLLIGHNPAFTELSCLLSPNTAFHLPTAGIYSASLAQDSWEETLHPKHTTLLFIDYPKRYTGTGD